MSLHIHTDTGSRTVPVRSDVLLTELAADAGLALNTRCAGNGVCGGCAVKLGPGRYQINGECLDVGKDGYQTALACRTLVLSESASVVFPRTSVLEKEVVIDDEFSLPQLAGRWAATGSVTGNSGLGLAVDIGTTTVAVRLIDLMRGEGLARASMYNQQIRTADDVASRISYADTPERLCHLQGLIIQETLNPLIEEVTRKAGRSGDDILRVAISGNTVMTHLFFGLSPTSIGVLPFTPCTRWYDSIPAKEIGLQVNPEAPVEAVPSIAGYVGGDIVSDIYLTRMNEPCAATVMIDVGTNGEMVFRDGDRIAACATAAGPAFEGYGLAHGGRAAAGAIERIEFDASLRMKLRVIGNQRPVSLCGSAIIDFLACGLRSGLINMMGRYDVNLLKNGGRFFRDEMVCGGSLACIVAPERESGIEGPLFITEHDIAQVLKAKAAIYAGLTTLLETLNFRIPDLQRIYLAGGFARHISLRNAVSIGLFPDIPLDRYEIIGNGSLAGACLTLLDPQAAPAYRLIMDQPRIVELNRIPSFESHFIDALALPHMDEDRFPSVRRDMERANNP